jgi:hypothetical protein
MVVLLLAGPALAGRQPFTELQGEEVLPARIVELQAAVDERVGTPDRAGDDVASVWGAAFGLSRRVELVLNTEVAYQRASDATAFTWYGGQVRWRLAKPGPPPGPWRPVLLIRLGVERFMAEDLAEGRLDLVVGMGVGGPLHAVVNASGLATSDLASARLEGGLGVLADATQATRAGAELYAEVPLSPSPLWSLGRDTPSVAAGPTVSVTEGPFWITVGGLAGLGERRAYDAELHLAWGVEL